ncbi:MAG TPA: triose-phosphate isomerase [Acidimicrobiia bacterium]
MTDRKPLMVGNWKMNVNHLEAIQVVQKLTYRLESEDYDRAEVVVAPAFTALRSVQLVIEQDHMLLGLAAQDVHWEPQGAFTGEVSAPMLAKLACRYVIVGHSERRQMFGETDETVNKKARAVLASDMSPIVCVGETLEERDAGKAEEVVTSQVRAGLARLEQPERVVVAYEPVWAIGTGRNALPDDAALMAEIVRETIRNMYDSDVADRVRVLYGGSVNPGNIKDFMAKRHIDGVLVGGASLDPDSFAAIVRYWR